MSSGYVLDTGSEWLFNMQMLQPNQRVSQEILGHGRSDAQPVHKPMCEDSLRRSRHACEYASTKRDLIRVILGVLVAKQMAV